ncbi:atrial natriuretic peptide receptor 1-like [Mytilus californianus]|uniref:atrial natriuretic peptide receptor 1-like n=1 Tax=Mytilus californianus TaxID=6549 RepID=UPI002247EE5F|nr:atrial natriuretic peptide receptor 1-like [Mytilus californianus]
MKIHMRLKYRHTTRHKYRGEAQYIFICAGNDNHECIWFAPECLRGDKVSQSSDVYSFAMIMFEILTRMSPFEEEAENASIHDVIRKIKTKGDKPFRPSLPAMSDDVPKMIDLMQACWDESLFKRPTFRSIKKQLKEITGISASHNILDALLRRMEQYANNLEELVGQRTEAFLEEKKKSDQLLEQLLPKTVADKLKNNQIVDPEAYDRVTIYFSDIVGFTSLSAESSPMEVVDLLNDLYCVFDAIIERYDVYKVETIGDAYMVVSGLPTRNGDDHVRQIAMMSLEIVQNVGIFKIRHLPEKHLQARIGIHTGPVCAGVVGTKMPRFCLFGDTVNTASRMESHGEAMKIHVSPETKSLLDKHGGFVLEPRGNIEIKGKGLMTTHWLIREIRESQVIPNHDLTKYDPKIVITDDESVEMQPQFLNIATTSKPLEEDQRSIFNGII